MPTEKRQRQKEGRRARLEAERKVQRRNQLLKRTLLIVVIAAVVVGSLFAVGLVSLGGGSSTSPQQQANQVAVQGGCPEQPATASAPANTLSWKSPPKMTLDTKKKYYATIDTTKGDLEVQLNVKGAPVNVNSFVFLADKGFYKCNTFWRVIPGFMDQTGDPTSAGNGGPGYTVPVNEFPAKVAAGKVQYPVGTVAVANSCPQSDSPSQCPPTNGSQFFIMAGTSSPLPPEYTVLGHVIQGQSVVTAINQQGNSNSDDNGSPPAVINRIISVTIGSVG